MTFRKGGCVNCPFVVWPVALLLLLTVAVPVFAQNATGTILGVVKDSQGGAVGGATVTIRNTETGLTRSLTTADDGSYRAPALPVGGYSVKVEKTGFKSSTHDGLTLNVTDEMAVNFALEIGASTQVVVVTGEAPQVETTTSTLGGLVDEKRMADLPLNGRNYADLTLLQPGISKAVNVGNINSNTQGVWMSSNGAPLRSNNFTLDGARLNNQQGANPASAGGNTLGVDGIREYKVVTDMFGAEYGIGMGSQVVMTSKGGTNQFHGDAFDYLRNSIFDANINKALARKSDSTNVVARPAHIKNNFGGAFGGPIKKDKMFFYAVFEGIRDVVSQGASTHALPFGGVPGCSTAKMLIAPSAGNPNGLIKGSPDVMVNGTLVAGSPSTTNPCTNINLSSPTINPYAAIPAALIPFPNVGSNWVGNALNRNGENYGQIRFDDNISSTDSLFVRFTEDEFHANNDSKYPEYGVLQAGRNHFATVGESHVFSASLLNTLRLSFSRTYTDGQNYVKTANAASSGIPMWAACPTLDCTASIANDASNIAAGFTPNQAVSYSFSNNKGTGSPCPTGAFIVGYGAPGNFGSTDCNEVITGQNVYTLGDDMFYSKGRHALKFGFLGNRFNQIVGQGAGGANSIGGEAQFGGPQYLLGGIPFPFWDLRSFTPDSATYWTYNTFGFYAQDDIRVNSRLTVNVGLRYEFNTTPTELSGKQYTHLNILTDSYAGTQGAIMQNDSLKNFSPRLGFALDVFGNGKTAVRAGFGIYHDVGSIGSAISQYSNANGTNTNYWVGSPIYSFNPTFTTPFPTVATVDPRNLVLHTLDYHSKQPHILQYNLTVQQQLPWKLALQVGYVGSRGINLFRLTEQNPFKQVTCTGSNCIPGLPFWGMDPTSPQGRINPNFASATMVTTGSNSWYNAAEVGVTMRGFHGVDLQTAYTFSRNLDTTQSQQYVFDCFSAQGSGQGIDPTNPNTDKGPTCFDAAHNLRINFLYHFPSPKSNGFLSKVLGGWWMGNIVSIQSGYPFNVNTAGLISNNGVFNFDQGERPNIVTAANLAAAQMIDPAATVYDRKTLVTGNPDGWYNSEMFTLLGPNAKAPCNQDIGGPGNGGYATSAPDNNPTNYGNINYGPTCYYGYLGDEPRNDIRGPRLREWNLSINKDTKVPFLGENGQIQFRAEMFNLLNHANWGFISNTNFLGCAPFALSPYTAYDPTAGPGNNNGACAGSNEAGVPAKGNTQLNGVGPLRQMQFALKLIF